MDGPSQRQEFVSYSWDSVFTTFRSNFHAPSENVTPDEDLSSCTTTQPSYPHRRRKGRDVDNVTETAERFMFSPAGSGNGPASFHHWRPKVVSAFCSKEQSDLPGSRDGEGLHKRLVALLYEWENKPLQRGRHREAYPYPLTHEELYFKLSAKRYGDPASWPEGTIDADRRIIYINTLDPFIISIIAQTTSNLETPVIQRTIFQHLTARTSFQVHTATSGFKTFSMELNVSYFHLREDATNLKEFDTRQRWDRNGPLRETLLSPVNPTEGNLPADEHPVFKIYETQLSVAVTGVDYYRWTAWGFFDTWFERDDTVLTYYEGPEEGGRPDPLSAGQMDVGTPEPDPREYFLRIFEIRICMIAREWEYILHVVQQEVQRTASNPLFNFPEPSFKNKHGRQKIRELAAWNSHMVGLVRTLLKSLSQTLMAWEMFEKTDIGYFLDSAVEDNLDSKSSPSHANFPSSSFSIGGNDMPQQSVKSPDLLPSLRVIEKTFLNLHIAHEEMEQLKLTLQDLQAALARGEENYSTFVQQRTGEHVKLLTWVTIFWSPVIIATGMCSAHEGIFPFRNNIWDFFVPLFIVSGLVGLTIVVLLTRQGSFSDLVDCKVLSSACASAGTTTGNAGTASGDNGSGRGTAGASVQGERRRSTVSSFVSSRAGTFASTATYGGSSRRWTGGSGKPLVPTRNWRGLGSWELGGLAAARPNAHTETAVLLPTYKRPGNGHGLDDPDVNICHTA